MECRYKTTLISVWMQCVKACLRCVTRWKMMMAGGQQADLRPFVLKIKLSGLAQDLVPLRGRLKHGRNDKDKWKQ